MQSLLYLKNREDNENETFRINEIESHDDADDLDANDKYAGDEDGRNKVVRDKTCVGCGFKHLKYSVACRPCHSWYESILIVSEQIFYKYET